MKRLAVAGLLTALLLTREPIREAYAEGDVDTCPLDR